MAPAVEVSNSWDSSLMPELLPIYYKKLFPFTQYFKWLRYKESGPNYFKNREFSFTLKDDIYLRYRSYADQAEMEKDIRSKCPYKIDIGAVYTCSVCIQIHFLLNQNHVQLSLTLSLTVTLRISWIRVSLSLALINTNSNIIILILVSSTS